MQIIGEFVTVMQNQKEWVIHLWEMEICCAKLVYKILH